MHSKGTVIPKTRKVRPVDIILSRTGNCLIGSQYGYFDCPILPGDITNHNSRIVSQLDRIRRRSNKDVFIPENIFGETMKALRTTGLSYYYGMGDPFTNQMDTIHNSSGMGARELQIRAEAHPILWECIYTGDEVGEINVENFWGIKYGVSRVLPGDQGCPDYLASPELFLFGHNHNLAFAQDEQSDLTNLAKQRNLKIYFLDELLTAHSTGFVELSDRTLLSLHSQSWDFVHLACHLIYEKPLTLSTSSSSVLNYCIELSHKDTAFVIPLVQLNAWKRNAHFTSTPVVFLNACKSMSNAGELSQSDSFPRSFLRLGASAVIATACDIPDLFAKEFAKKFYEILFTQLDESPKISEVLRQTRQYFLRDKHNPLGLMYGLYAYSDLYISWETPQ